MKSKQQLQDSSLLVHYDLKKPLRFACDTSPYGARAVISHVMEDGTEKPIAFASRTLTSSERNYSQKPLWPQVYVDHGSPAIGLNFWSQDRCTPVVSSTNAKVVLDFGSLPV